MNLHQEFKMMKQVLIEQWRMFNKIYHVIGTGTDDKQMESLRDMMD